MELINFDFSKIKQSICDLMDQCDTNVFQQQCFYDYFKDYLSIKSAIFNAFFKIEDQLRHHEEVSSELIEKYQLYVIKRLNCMDGEEEKIENVIEIKEIRLLKEYETRWQKIKKILDDVAYLEKELRYFLKN